MAMLLHHMPNHHDWPFAPLRPFSLLDPAPLKKARRNPLQVRVPPRAVPLHPRELPCFSPSRVLSATLFRNL